MKTPFTKQVKNGASYVYFALHQYLLMRMPKALGSPVMVLCLLLSTLSLSTQAQNAGEKIPGQYIVVYKSNAMTAKAPAMRNQPFAMRQQVMQGDAASLLRRANLQTKTVLNVYSTALQGFAVSGLTEADVAQLRKDDNVAYVVQDKMVFLDNALATNSKRENTLGQKKQETKDFLTMPHRQVAVVSLILSSMVCRTMLSA